MTTKTDILSPVGRLVQGSAFEGNTTDNDGRPLTDRNGSPRTNYFLGLAVPKDSPDWAAFKAQIDAVAAAAWPNQWHLPTFSNKIIDGDDTTPDMNGNRPCDKEGFAGHWVVRFSSGFAPQVYTKGGTAIITDQTAIKRGDYIRVYGSTSSNGNAQKPGVYVNLGMVEFIGHGVEISSGPSGAAIFGGTPAAHVPAGVSSTPVAPSVPLAPPATPVAPPVAPPPAAPAVQPAPDFLNAAPPAPVAPPAEADKIIVNGVGYTEQQLKSAGWTEAQIQQAIEAMLPF